MHKGEIHAIIYKTLKIFTRYWEQWGKSVDLDIFFIIVFATRQDISCLPFKWEIVLSQTNSSYIHMVTSINCCVDILLVEKNTVEEDSSEDILRIKIAP